MKSKNSSFSILHLEVNIQSYTKHLVGTGEVVVCGTVGGNRFHILLVVVVVGLEIGHV